MDFLMTACSFFWDGENGEMMNWQKLIKKCWASPAITEKYFVCTTGRIEG